MTDGLLQQGGEGRQPGGHLRHRAQQIDTLLLMARIFQHLHQLPVLHVRPHHPVGQEGDAEPEQSGWRCAVKSSQRSAMVQRLISAASRICAQQAGCCLW